MIINLHVGNNQRRNRDDVIGIHLNYFTDSCKISTAEQFGEIKHRNSFEI